MNANSLKAVLQSGGQAIGGWCASPTPLVRAPFGDAGVAQRALDAGAEGLVFPLINGEAATLAAVDACRYPLTGQRSYGPVRARMHLGPEPDHANSQVL
jgi:4-hydroxy-2-oxoheptanedioate aldolase